MIWVWVAWILRALHALLSWQVFRAEDAVPDPIDRNETCPGCGHNSGKIRCVEDTVTHRKLIEHRCNVCGAGWFVATVVQEKDKDTIHPSEDKWKEK